MFLTQISEGGILSIYDKTKLMCRTWIESVNNLFNMGKDLETEVDGLKGGIVKDVTLTEVDKHYTLTILYDDNTSDTVTWDDSTVGIEDITLNYSDGVYILAIELTDGTRYTFSIPVGDIVTIDEFDVCHEIVPFIAVSGNTSAVSFFLVLTFNDNFKQWCLDGEKFDCDERSYEIKISHRAKMLIPKINIAKLFIKK